MDDLLTVYEEQLRTRAPDPLPNGTAVERDGPVLRFTGFADRGFVLYRDLRGFDVDEVIRRQVAAFAARGEAFEWKLHGHDEPRDLPQRLRAAGFVPEDEETVVIAPVAAVAATPVLPEGVSLREVSERRDLERIDELEQAVWGAYHGGGGRPSEFLSAELATDPDALAVVVAEAGGTVVCAAWVRFERGTAFATFWGGATLPEWRGRGIYRATVAYRAGLAAERGFRFVEVDASSDSRPILERLGFVAVTTTTPYVWTPPRTAS